MSFANPYNFVSIDENKVDRKTYPEKGEYCGKMTCRLLFLSNFITAGKNTRLEKRQLEINKKIGIQATSLKGLLRATAEAISNSCISMISDKYKYPFSPPMPVGTSSSSGVDYQRKEGKDRKLNLVFDQKKLVDGNALIKACDSENGLCLCCMLFGTTAKENEETNESFNFKGKVRVLDAIYLGIYKNNTIEYEQNPKITKYLREHSLSNPKNYHESFYLNGTKIKGRKFYYHHKKDKLLDIKPTQSSDKKATETISYELVKKDSVFEFTIYFENLTKEEYGLLLTTLELEPGLGHKIGMGKPLGLGSCVIDVREIVEYSKNRYLSINNSDEIYNYDNNNILKRKKEIKEGGRGKIPDDLRCILTIDNGFEINYPSRYGEEFRGPLHKPCENFSGEKIKSPAKAKNPPSNPIVTWSSTSMQK